MGNCQVGACSSVIIPSCTPTTEDDNHKQGSMRESSQTVAPTEFGSERSELFQNSSKSFSHHQIYDDLTEKDEPNSFDCENDSCCDSSSHQRQELGTIRYQFSSLDERAYEESRRCFNKPIMFVQAEIPGDVDAGDDIFSHQLIVEAAESLFVTVFDIVKELPKKRRRSNSSKVDRTRVRFLNECGDDLVEEVWGDTLLVAQVVPSMVSSLKLCEKPVPKFMELLLEEVSGKAQICNHKVHVVERKAVFGVSSSRTGEVELAGLDGVISTSAGFIDHRHVVQVTYDSSRISFGHVVLYALKRNVADKIYYQTNDERMAAQMELQKVNETSTTTMLTTAAADNINYLMKLDVGAIKPDFDSKHALRKTALRFIPLTELQATRANRLIDTGVFNEAMHLLSPRQGMMLMRTMHDSRKGQFQDLVGVPLTRAWSKHMVVSKNIPVQTS